MEDVVAAAACYNSTEVFQALLDYGVAVDENLDRAITPLAQAVLCNAEKTTAFLLSKGADPNRPLITGTSFLAHTAGAPRKSSKILNLLLEHGARIENSGALKEASENGRIANAKRLLEAGADINEVFKEKDSMSGKVTQFGTALHYAVKGEKVGMIRLLLDRGANTTRVDIGGKTPLQRARENGKDEIVRIFQEHDGEKSA